MTTTQHPERRAGQRWKWERNGVVYIAVLMRPEGQSWHCKGEDADDGWFCNADWNGTNGATMTLLSEAPAKAVPDRSKCEQWCGHRTNEQNGARRMGRPLGAGFTAVNPGYGPRDEWPVWCTEACRDAKYPPIESKPAEAGCVCPHGPHTTDGSCPVHVTVGLASSGFFDCECAKCKPPAQEAPKAERGNWRERAAWMAAQSGTPYAGPERLPTPKLAHVAGNHDDDLVTW